jgi:hypothetical protein
VANEWFDLVIIIGNSFSLLDSDKDRSALVQEISRVLKPGGLLLIDLPKAKWLRSNYSERRWEWIHESSTDDAGLPSESAERRMLAFHESELSPDGKWFASREIAVDLDKGACNDMLCRIRLYDPGELDTMLDQCGITLRCMNSGKPKGNDEVGMGLLAHRDLVVAQKISQGVEKRHRVLPAIESQQTRATSQMGLGFYRHPSLALTTNPRKGRSLTATASIVKDSILMKASSYAMVPWGSRIVRFCSHPECSRSIYDTSVTCLNDCFKEVEWCSANCRFLDTTRHSLECEWLSKVRLEILSKHTDYYFRTLWLVMRVLVRRHLELRKGAASTKQVPTTTKPTLPEASNWTSYWALISHEGHVPTEQVEQWRSLAKNYLQGSVVTENLDVPYLASVFSKEESNSFGLHRYPTESAQFDPRVTYGAGVYLVAANFNHSCQPNVTHEPDDEGRMVFRALRDIEPGEECCVVYFDLKEYATVEERRAALEDMFQFVCMCERCEGGWCIAVNSLTKFEHTCKAYGKSIGRGRGTSRHACEYSFTLLILKMVHCIYYRRFGT